VSEKLWVCKRSFTLLYCVADFCYIRQDIVLIQPYLDLCLRSMTFTMYVVYRRSFIMRCLVDFIENHAFKKLWLCLQFQNVVTLLVQQRHVVWFWLCVIVACWLSAIEYVIEWNSCVVFQFAKYCVHSSCPSLRMLYHISIVHTTAAYLKLT